MKATAPRPLRPGERGAVVALTQLVTEHLASHHARPLGSTVYTVEFADGSDREVPEDLLEPT